MKSVISLSHLLVLSLMIFGIVEGSIDYGSILGDVHDEYMTGSVIMSARNDFSLERSTMIHKISRELSARRISSVFINFMELEGGITFHSRQCPHPLVVILMDDMSELYHFPREITKIHPKYPLKLVLFIGKGTEDHCRYCHDPIGNPFNLGLTSRMLILCCDSEHIEEWWSGEENQTITLPRGKWDEGVRKFNWYANGSIYNDEQSIGKRGFRVVVVERYPYIWMKDKQLHGIFGELVTDFCKSMNYSISQIIEETTGGQWDMESSMWTGAMGVVVRGEADLGVSGYVMNNERGKAVDFTLPLQDVSKVLGIRKPDEMDITWNACFQPFHGMTWMVITIFLLIIPLLLTIIKYKRKYNFLDMLFEHYLTVWGILCQKPLPDSPNGVHLRIVYITTYMMAILSYAMYSAVFISFLTNFSLHLPFRSLEEFVSDGTYKLTLVKNGPEHLILQTSTVPLSKTIQLMLIPEDSLPLSDEEALEQICTKRYAYLYNPTRRPMADVHSPCEITFIEVGFIQYVGMIMPKNSEFAEPLKSFFQRTSSNGMMSRLKAKYFWDSTEIPDDSYKPVTLKGVVSILIIFAMGFSIAFVIFCIEIP